MRQLQAECVSEVTVKRVGLARCSEAGGFQPSRKVLEVAPGSAPRLSRPWVDRLQKDKQIMQRRQQRLEAKLPKLQVRYLKAFKRPLRLEPQLLDEHLATCLQSQELGPPGSPWEDLLARLLQEVPGRLGRQAEEARLRAISAQLRSQQQRILAFLECCLLTGHLPLAHHVLVTYHSRPQQQLQLTLAMYNTVMLGWARKVSGIPKGVRWAPSLESAGLAWGSPCPHWASLRFKLLSSLQSSSSLLGTVLLLRPAVDKSHTAFNQKGGRKFWQLFSIFSSGSLQRGF